MNYDIKAHQAKSQMGHTTIIRALLLSDVGMLIALALVRILLLVPTNGVTNPSRDTDIFKTTFPIGLSCPPFGSELWIHSTRVRINTGMIRVVLR